MGTKEGAFVYADNRSNHSQRVDLHSLSSWRRFCLRDSGLVGERVLSTPSLLAVSDFDVRAFWDPAYRVQHVWFVLFREDK